jgi:O-antigen/teichoic acid export membrane protein/glycosyltransferase involved in cell wall biosynthesis
MALMADLATTRSRLAELVSQSAGLSRLISLARWTLVSFALEKGATMVVVFLLARTLGAEDYGRLSLAQGLVNTMQIFVVLGAGAVLGRYVPALRQESVRRAVEIINLCAGLVLGSAALFLILASTIGRSTVTRVLHVPDASPIVGWVIAWVLLAAAVNLLVTVMLSFERGKALGLASLVGAVVAITVVPVLAETRGLAGAVFGLMTVEVLKLLMLGLMYRRLVREHGAPVLARPRASDLRLLARFGVPVFLTSALWAPTMWLAQSIIGARSPGGLTDVGVFAFTNSLLGAVILISSLTNQAALPVLSSLRGEGKLGELRRVSTIMALAQLGVAVVIATPLALLAPWIMNLAGPAFYDHWTVLLIMILTGVVLSAQTALGNYLLVTDRQVYLLITMIGWSAVVLGLTLTFVSYGAYALAGALMTAAILRTAAIGLGFLSSPSPLVRAGADDRSDPAGELLPIQDGESSPANWAGRERMAAAQGRVLLFQPALPRYRIDFFDRLSHALGPSFRVFYSPQSLGVLTELGDAPPWAQAVGRLRRPLPGVEWQDGVLSTTFRPGDIVVVSGAPRCLSNLLLLLKARLSGAVTIWWGHYWSGTTRSHRFAVRMRLMRMAHAVLFYTDLEVSEYRAGVGAMDRRPILALNNGIDTVPVERLRASYRSIDRERAGLFIGRVTEKSRLELVLRAMAKPKLADFALHVIGDGRDRDKLIALSETLGISARVHWHDATVDEARIAPIANRCRLFVYPGSVGLSLIHGMAYGLPAIVHDHRKTHMPEVAAFQSGVTGLSFVPEDVDSLVASIADALSDEARLDGMSARCIAVTRDGYNTAAMAERFVDALRRAREAAPYAC